MSSALPGVIFAIRWFYATPGAARSHLMPRGGHGLSRGASAVFRFLALAILIAGCGGDARGGVDQLVVDTMPGGWLHVRNTARGLWDMDPGARWQVVEHARIGRVEGEGPDVFGRVRSLVEDALGRVWVADVEATEVRVFDQDGRFIRTVGKQGAGPGEFSSLGSLHVGPNGNIWVDDARLRRWEVFDTAGVRVAGYRHNSNFLGGIRRWMFNGRLLEINRRPRGGDAIQWSSVYVVRHLDQSGELALDDTIAEPDLPDSEIVTFASEGKRSTSNVGSRLLITPT